MTIHLTRGQSISLATGEVFDPDYRTAPLETIHNGATGRTTVELRGAVDREACRRATARFADALILDALRADPRYTFLDSPDAVRAHFA